MKLTLKKKWMAAALAPVFGLALTGDALAQNAQTQQQGQQQPGQPERSAEAKSQQRQNIRDMRASELIGATVQDSQGRELGEVQDLIVDATNHRADYAILAYGGVLGFREKLFAYPIERFQAVRSGDEEMLVLNVTEEELKNAPGFDRSNWPSFGDSGYRGEVDKHFGRTAAAGGDVVRMSELLDTEVVDRAGNEVGEINDVVVSVSNGQVRFVALQPSDDLNMGERLVMLPMSAIRATGEQQARASGASGTSGESGERQQDAPAQQADSARQDAATQQEQQTSGASGSARQQQQQQQQQAGQGEQRDLMLVLSVPPEHLKNARSFEENAWPEINSRAFQRETERYVAAFPSGKATSGGGSAEKEASGGDAKDEPKGGSSGSSGKDDAQSQ